MKKLHVGIVDLVTKAPTRSLWARVMFPNFASIMPQVIGTWCKQLGHDVRLVCYTGFEDLEQELPTSIDIVFISAFSHAAQLSYALSQLFRARGAVTAIGGPHARCYPEDASKYFDYVFGFTDKQLLSDVLEECEPHRPEGIYVSAPAQPAALPGVKERWEFVEPILAKAPLLKIVSMIGSLGCPYTCSFCIDSEIPYQQLDFDVIKEDLRFLLTKFKRPRVGWHDPNFGVRFEDYLGAIEEAAPPDSIDFYAETSLSLLSEARLRRLQRNGFKVLMPGIESWFDMGNKSKTGRDEGLDKAQNVAEQINLVLRYIPYLQANFVLGLDVDQGPEPFEVTKRFIDLAPAAYPAYCLLSAFGRAAPLNLTYQREGRVLPFPFHFLNTQEAMNVRPKNYTWTEFFDYLIDLNKYTFSWSATVKRYQAMLPTSWRLMNVLRGRTGQGIGRARFYGELRRRLETDRQLRDFYEQETTELPQFLIDKIRSDLGPFWEWLPKESLYHDANAYLHAQPAEAAAV